MLWFGSETALGSQIRMADNKNNNNDSFVRIQKDRKTGGYTSPWTHQRTNFSKFPRVDNFQQFEQNNIIIRTTENISLFLTILVAFDLPYKVNQQITVLHLMQPVPYTRLFKEYIGTGTYRKQWSVTDLFALGPNQWLSKRFRHDILQFKYNSKQRVVNKFLKLQSTSKNQTNNFTWRKKEKRELHLVSNNLWAFRPSKQYQKQDSIPDKRGVSGQKAGKAGFLTH